MLTFQKVQKTVSPIFLKKFTLHDFIFEEMKDVIVTNIFWPKKIFEIETGQKKMEKLHFVTFPSLWCSQMNLDNVLFK